MGNMERAPEPTMEEILASIRRIIADDDQGESRGRPEAAHVAAEPGPDSAEMEADSQIIDDIARVLSGGQGGGEEDDVLDLTRELGLTPLSDESDQPAMDEPMLHMDEPTLEMMQDAEFELDAPEPEPEPEFTLESISPEPRFEPAPEPSPEPKSMADEATSALEQAIAALRAGRLGSAGPAPPAFVPDPEPEAAPEPESELVLTEFAAVELVMEEPGQLDPRLSADEADTGEDASWSSDLADLQSESEDEGPLDFVAARMSGTANGGASYESSYTAPESPYAEPASASSKTLEDSVKEMLRPMLRQWLDENMSRVLTAALREELEQGRVGRHDG